MESRRAGGRRPGNTQTRDAILEAAMAAFIEKGYTATTIRGVARSAEVDPALVMHFFGNKEGLFEAAIREGGMPVQRLTEVVHGDPGELAERVLRRYLAMWEDPLDGARLRAVLNAASTSPAAAELLKTYAVREILQPMIKAVSAEQSETRAILAGSHLVGIAFLRYVLKAEPMAALTTEELVAWVAPTLQRYLTGPLPTT
jgi:AcrR family transcriptional regulator